MRGGIRRARHSSFTASLTHPLATAHAERVDIPDTHYAKTDDGLSIAYQVIGDGPIDIVFPGSGGLLPIDLIWDEPSVARLYHRLASFSRLVVFDALGTGASDDLPLGQLPTVETISETVGVVMDAVGTDRAAILGCGNGGGQSTMLFAATHPERTRALVLLNAFARSLRAEDYPVGMPALAKDNFVRRSSEEWGTPEIAQEMAPSLAGDERARQYTARGFRLVMNRASVVALLRHFFESDHRSVLSSIRVPTLVVHTGGNPYVRVGHGRYLAEHITDAKYVEVQGDDHLPYFAAREAIVDAIEEFLTGVRPVPESDRALATVLFTDLVDSTRHAAELGDKRWREVLDQHDALCSRELDRHRGKKVHSIGLGDGVLATFDGPARAISFAQTIVQAVRLLGLEVRAGLHTGEVELRGDDIGGIAVHIGQRVSALAGPGEVLVSRTVTDLVAGSGLQFEERGEHVLKGVPGKMAIYAVKPGG
jgi:class 3 adenylate cyclase